jgi:hypothetical protein
MYQTTFVNLLILIGLIPVGIFLAWGILRGLDKLSGQSFKRTILPEISSSPTIGIYYGLRFFGVCYLVGQLASRFV